MNGAPPAANAEQLAAIEETGVVFVSAGAGTGKTTVLVERFLKAVLERGLAIDSILVITYTERAAGELRERIRARLRELGRRDLARELDRAWISTIHAFCARLLRAHPFEAGLDPRFRVLDESQARVLRAEAFQAALAAFCADGRPERVRLLATYGARGLQAMLTGVFERLRSAGRPLVLDLEAPAPLAERVAELRRLVTDWLARPETVDPERSALERLLEQVGEGTPPERLRSLADLGTGDVSLTEAIESVERAALEEIATRDRGLLEELLTAFDDGYRRAKARESAVDFEDLQLFARALLRDDADLRERIRFRFRAVLVDEFQDTNRLQCELIDLVAGGAAGEAPIDLFFVGDEFQSIYRFRHADVDVFRERRSASGGVLVLTRNYRSRPEVLAVVNHVFSPEFGTEFAPLDAAGRFPDPSFGPAVEVLVTDKAAYRGSGLSWRQAEARHVARRVRELVDGGGYSPGDVVLLFAAGTNAERYEEALRAEALPTFRAAGRGYFGQQQVVDLLAYLRLLQNRYDDEALVTVLASPLVGVSNDALVLLRRAARGPLFTGLEREPPAGLSARDSRLLAAFRQRYDRLCRLSTSAGLERLCERITAEHDYDLAVLARWDGRRRYANLRKLARLARSYEDLRGPDLEGFVQFVRDQETAGVREAEAVAEEEGADAVRLLTIHAAKGLEFKVVVVCDAGRVSGPSAADEILCLPDGRFGFRVADPVTGKRVGVLGYDEVRQAERAAEEAETRRLYYVAMTRAIDRLVLSGAVDPTRKGVERTPIGWIIERLGAGIDADGPVELDCGGATVLLSVDRPVAAEVTPAPAVAEQLELFAPEPGPEQPLAFELQPLRPLPELPPRRVRRLSYSALALFERCPYRFFAERFAGLSPQDRRSRGEPTEGLSAAEIGDAVHACLELGIDGAAAASLVRERFPAAAEGDARRVGELVDAWHRSPLAARVAGLSGVEREQPFVFEHDGVLLHGRFDLLRTDGSTALVVDYKTNRLEGRSPHEIVEAEYRLQRLVYALAVLRAGVSEVEVAHVFLERPDDVVAEVARSEELPALEAELSAAIGRIHTGAFPPTPGELVCADCPLLDRVCAGPRLPVAPARDPVPVRVPAGASDH